MLSIVIAMDGPLEEGTDQIDEEHVPEDIFGPPVIDESACTPTNNNVGDAIGEEKEDSPTPTRENRRYIQQNKARFEDGYDSEGFDTPYVPPFVEPIFLNDDDKIPTCVTAPIVEDTTAAAAVTTDGIPTGTIEPIPDNVLPGMKIPQLKEELKLRNEPVSGNKNALIARLTAALLKPKYSLEELELVRNATKKKKAATNTTSGLKSFPITAWWRPLIPNEEAVLEPENPSFNNKVRPPTVEQRDAGKLFIKHISMNNLIFQCMRRQIRHINNEEDVISTS